MFAFHDAARRGRRLSLLAVLLSTWVAGLSVAAPAAPAQAEEEEGDWAYAMYTCAPEAEVRRDQMILVWANHRSQVLSLSTAQGGARWPDYAKALMQGGTVGPDPDFIKVRPGLVIKINASEVQLPLPGTQQTLQCRPALTGDWVGLGLPAFSA